MIDRIALFLLSSVFCAVVFADVQSGRAAFEAGRFDEAFRLYAPLAEQGDRDAQYALGLMYANGQGVTQNFYEAGKWYRRAGEQGHAGAQVNLGSLFENCRGNGPCSSEKAAVWYRRAADQGDAIAQYNLGVMYATGEGVEESEWQAKRLFRRSAEQGHAPAQYNLGVTYENGMGGPVDKVAAYAWYDLAAQAGVDYSAGSRDRIASTLSDAELEKAVSLGRLLDESYGN